jgi:hypothetical protein
VTSVDGAGPVATTSPASAARPATVRPVKTSRGRIARPAARARPTSWIATMLSPPSAKKSSSTPTSGRPSSWAKTRLSASSRASRGAVPPAVNTGAGSALRSSLPFGVSGSGPSSTITAAGTM